MNKPYTIIIQEIRTTWDKDERGGANAALRNSVPEVLAIPVPLKIAQEPSYLLHNIWYPGHTWDQPYTTNLKVESADKILNCRNHYVQPEDDVIKVVFPYRKKRNPSRYYYIDPVTKHFPEQQGLLTLQPGQWVQFLYNERYRNFPDHGNRTYYEKWVINIGLFFELTPTVLLDHEPAHVISQLKHIR